MNPTRLSALASSWDPPQGPASLPALAAERAVHLEAATPTVRRRRGSKVRLSGSQSAAPDPGTAAQGRCPVIRQRGFGATRQGWEALREQLHAEARWRGLSQAAGARVLGDGAVCFWGLAEDRWPQARQRLDYWHAVEQLAAVSRARFGKTVRRWRRGWSR